jgi:hypothetical protein
LPARQSNTSRHGVFNTKDQIAIALELVECGCIALVINTGGIDAIIHIQRRFHFDLMCGVARFGHGVGVNAIKYIFAIDSVADLLIGSQGIMHFKCVSNAAGR